MELGRSIHWLRVEAGITQSELSKVTRVSEPYITLIEKGDRRVSRSMMDKFVAYFGVPVTALVFLEEYPVLGEQHQGLINCMFTQYPVLAKILELERKEQEEKQKKLELGKLPMLRPNRRLGIRRKKHSMEVEEYAT